MANARIAWRSFAVTLPRSGSRVQIPSPAPIFIFAALSDPCSAPVEPEIRNASGLQSAAHQLLGSISNSLSNTAHMEDTSGAVFDKEFEIEPSS